MAKLRDVSRRVVTDQRRGVRPLLSGRALRGTTALVSSKVLHAVVLTAKPGSAVWVRTFVVLFASVYASMSGEVPGGGEGLSAMASVLAGRLFDDRRVGGELRGAANLVLVLVFVDN